jgi:hypothetical protein
MQARYQVERDAPATGRRAVLQYFKAAAADPVIDTGRRAGRKLEGSLGQKRKAIIRMGRRSSIKQTVLVGVRRAGTNEMAS